MKVNFNLNNNPKSISFEGYKPTKSDFGYKEYEFNFPFDESKYSCYVEFFKLEDGKINTEPLKSLDGMYGNDSNPKGFKLSPEINKIDLTSTYDIKPNETFAYHYKLYPLDANKNEKTDEVFYEVDSGSLADYKDDDKSKLYNIVTPGSTVSDGGAMKLLLPDSYNANWVYDKDNKIISRDEAELQAARKSNKSFANKVGGTIAGIEKHVEEGKFDGYSKIISTPLFTDDSVSHHAYWNKNCMQMANSLGNINNYNSLQKKMFAKGLNLVSDGAFVNEGLEGIHFKHVLKWADKSPYFNWFRIQGLQDSPLSLGIFSKNHEFIANRVVKKNGKTYIQLYDKRLVDIKKYGKNDFIEHYDKFDTGNSLDINTHNDTVIPFTFEINSDIYNRNLKTLEKHNKIHSDNSIDMDSFDAARLLMKFENWEAEEKFESGFETWDANSDIAKLNYVASHIDTLKLMSTESSDFEEVKNKLLRNNYEVQDYAITSGQYWTKKTNQILNLHVAQNLAGIDISDATKAYNEILAKIDNGNNNGVFPKKLKESINENVIENIFYDIYEFKKHPERNYKDHILAGLMDTPLDAFEVGDEISGVLASPMMSKRASAEEYIGKTRFELFKAGNPHIVPEYEKTYNKTDSIYTNEMLNFAKEVLTLIDKKLPENSKIKTDDEASEYGKYVLPLLTAEIAKFAMIKATNPKEQPKFNPETGEISYDYKKLKQTTLDSLGISAQSPKDEAVYLANKIKKGIENISAEDKKNLAQALYKSIEGTDANSFKLAEVIVDRTGSGLDWRIDATKDIADMEALRGNLNDFDYTWGEVINFWSKFSGAVTKENPNAYLAAEITDVEDLYYNNFADIKWKKGNQGKDYINNKTHEDTFYNIDIRGGRQHKMEYTEYNAVEELLKRTGMTTTADYTYFFHDLVKVFGKDFEAAKFNKNSDNAIFDLMVGKPDDIYDKGYRYSKPLDAIMYSYTFSGNHDKPRALHCLAMDMTLFHSDLTNAHNSHYSREFVYKLVKQDVRGAVTFEEMEKHDFSKYSPKAMAMAQSLLNGFGNSLWNLKEGKQISDDTQKQAFEAMVTALSQLAQGKYKGKNFEADGFGVKPFDVTIDLVLNQMEHNGFKLNENERKLVFEKTFETILKPATEKYQAIMKYLVALPGNPTMFAGDDLGATGYESKTKNIYLQNRNYIHHEWAEDGPDQKPFIKELKDDMEKIMTMRARPELRALNNGAPFLLSPQNSNQGNKVSAVFRQSTDGAMALSLFNAADIDHAFDKSYKPKQLTLPHIDFSKINEKDEYKKRAGLKAGVSEGAEFINANNPNDRYVVIQGMHGEYILKRLNPNGKTDNEKYQDIEINDSTLILYHNPKSSKNVDNSKPSFSGSRVLYNPQYNFVSSKAYNATKPVTSGSKLQLLSK